MTTTYMWRSEDNVEESVLSFQHVGPSGQTPVVRFSSKHFYKLSCLTSIGAIIVNPQIKQQPIVWEASQEGVTDHSTRNKKNCGGGDAVCWDPWRNHPTGICCLLMLASGVPGTTLSP